MQGNGSPFGFQSLPTSTVTTANLASASAVSLTNNTFSTVTSLTLSTGRYLIWGFVGIGYTGDSTRASGGISSANNAYTPVSNQIDGLSQISWVSTNAITNQRLSIAPVWVTPSASTTYYLVAGALFSTGASTAFGTLFVMSFP